MLYLIAGLVLIVLAVVSYIVFFLRWAFQDEPNEPEPAIAYGCTKTGGDALIEVPRDQFPDLIAYLKSDIVPPTPEEKVDEAFGTYL